MEEGVGHTKLESAIRFLGVVVDDALRISEQVELFYEDRFVNLWRFADQQLAKTQ